MQGGQRRPEPLLQQPVEREGPREGQGDPRDATGAEGQVERGDEADGDGHPLQRPQSFAEHNDAESDGDDRGEEVPEGRLGDVARDDRSDVEDPVHRDEDRGDGDAPEEQRTVQ